MRNSAQAVESLTDSWPPSAWPNARHQRPLKLGNAGSYAAAPPKLAGKPAQDRFIIPPFDNLSTPPHLPSPDGAGGRTRRPSEPQHPQLGDAGHLAPQQRPGATTRNSVASTSTRCARPSIASRSPSQHGESVLDLPDRLIGLPAGLRPVRESPASRVPPARSTPSARIPTSAWERGAPTPSRASSSSSTKSPPMLIVVALMRDPVTKRHSRSPGHRRTVAQIQCSGWGFPSKRPPAQTAVRRRYGRAAESTCRPSPHGRRHRHVWCPARSLVRSFQATQGTPQAPLA